MTALRTTRPDRGRRRTGVPLLPGLALALGLTGCGHPPAHRPTFTRLPPPPSDAIGYDADTRTLTFPDAPDATRWMVRVGSGGPPTPAGPDHQLPEGADPEYTTVYYRRPGGQTSDAVTLVQIRDAHDPHASLFR